MTERDCYCVASTLGFCAAAMAWAVAVGPALADALISGAAMSALVFASAGLLRGLR